MVLEFETDDTGYYGKPVFVLDAAARETLFSDDAGTTIADVGDPVRHIKCAAGTGKTALSASTSAPVLREDTDGTPYLELGGNVYTVNNTGLNETAALSFVMAIENNSAGSTQLIWELSPNANSNPGSAWLIYKNGNDKFTLMSRDAGYLNAPTASDFTTDQDLVLSSVIDRFKTAGDLFPHLRSDSAPDKNTVTSGFAAPNSNFSNEDLYLFGRSDGSFKAGGRAYYAAVYDYAMGPDMLLKAEQVAYSRRPTQGDFTTTPIKRAEPQLITLGAGSTFKLSVDDWTPPAEMQGARDWLWYFKGNLADLPTDQVLTSIRDTGNVNRLTATQLASTRVQITFRDGVIGNKTVDCDTPGAGAAELFFKYDQATGTFQVYNGDTEALRTAPSGAAGIGFLDGAVDISLLDSVAGGLPFEGDTERHAIWLDASVDITTQAGRDYIRSHLNSEFMWSNDGPSNNLFSTIDFATGWNAQNRRPVVTNNNAIGPDGLQTLATLDDQSGGSGGTALRASVQDFTATVGQDYTWAFVVAKQTSPTTFPEFQMLGRTNNTGKAWHMNLETGEIVLRGTDGSPTNNEIYVRDLGDHWLIWITLQANQTTVWCLIRPAAATTIGTLSNFATGSIDAGYVTLTEGLEPLLPKPVFDLYGDLDDWKTGRFHKV